MSISRPSPRLRRLAASTGALALAGTLALSGVAGGGVEMTEAAWSDTEVASAEVKAAWMQGFTRVTNPSWRMRNVRNSGLPDNIGMGGPVEVKKDFGLIYPAPSPSIAGFETADGDQRNKASFGTGADTSIVPSRTTTNNLWMGRFPSGALNGETDDARAGYCMTYPLPAVIGTTTSSCGGTSIPASRLYAAQNTGGFTYSIMASNGSKIARVNASGFSSSAQCSVDGTSSASISHSSGVLQLARETTTLNYSFDRERSITQLIPETDDSSILNDGTTNQWGQFNVEGSDPGNSSFVLAVNVRKNTYKAPYYALAEMDLIVQVYSAGGASSSPGTFIDQINLPLTRSECGFSNGNQPLPAMRGTFRGDDNQLGWPRQALGTTAPSTSSRLTTFTVAQLFSRGDSGPVAMREVEEKSAMTAELPPTTTVTSPLENSTASETTTSAPPNPSGEGESPTSGTSTAAATSTTRRTTTVTSTVPTVTAAPTSASAPPATQVTTSTSAAPAIVVPDEPGDLPATARTEKVGTVLVNGDELDVVVAGDTVPTGARTALTALDTWIADARQPSGDWTAFTSDDPDADGWRWAAINGKTGTVVYIR